ncbi:MAG: PKD domain-containing protein, partial [Bacteroidetes bacterium]
AGQLFTFNQGALDPDGDSLSYELGNCFDAAGTPVTYGTGFTPEQPLGPTWNVSVNALTGDVTMSPNPSGSEVTAVMCIVVKEWRNGVLIGTVTRDMQITVIANCTSSNPLTGGVQNVNLGVDDVPANALSYNEARVCAGVDICFDIPVVSQDPSLTYTISWNQGIPNATFSDASNPAIVNSISGAAPVGKFCWTPPLNAQGSYYFVVSVEDDACPVPGFNQFTVIVFVDDVLAQSSAIADYSGCNEVELSALPQSTIPGPYSNIFPVTNWTGNGNLNINPFTADSSLTHLYPAPGNYFYNLQLQDTFGCSITLPGVVNLTTGVTSNAGPDITICSNYNFTLGTPALPGLLYQWTPDTLLSNANAAQPTFTYPNDSLSQTTFNYIVQVTDGVCTTFDYTTVSVNPSLITTVQPSAPIVCPGDSVTLTAVGNLSSGYTYLWSNGATTPSITVAPSATTAYSVVTFNSGCSSDPAQVTVTVTPGPASLISGNTEVCPGGTTTLFAAGGVSYQWSVGGFSQPNIAISGITQDTSISVIAIDANGCAGPPTSVTLSSYVPPTASFAGSTVCEGVTTTFNDLSLGGAAPVTNWNWDFGDGGGASVANPEYAYLSPGTFPVTLIVTSERGCKDTVSNSIIVQPGPDADFTFTNVCQGLANQFVNTSVIEPGGTIANFTWTFGDGGPTSAGQAVSHTYATYGYYNVTLNVASDNGCSDAYTRTVFVHPNPEADFRIVSACEDSLVLASTASVVAGPLDYISLVAWNFGDPASGLSNTTNQLNPSHVYSGGAGEYLVTYAVQTANGCKDTLRRNVTVYPSPDADFLYDKTCENVETQFTDISQADLRTPIVDWYWNFDDGSITNIPNVNHSFISSGPGTYRVALGVKTTAGCVDTTYKLITINPAPFPDFSVDPVCLNDTSKIFDKSRVLSGSIISWQYTLGDGSVSSLSNPTHVYRAPGDFAVRLVVVTDSGCTRDRQLNATVWPLPQIQLIREDTACFGDKGVLAVIAPRDVEIEWYESLTDNTPFHTGNSYTTPSLPFAQTYYVKPISAFGCENERQPITASVYPSPQPVIIASQDVVEIPGAIVDFRTVSNLPSQTWQWSFGDGSDTDNSSEPSHEYQYPGKYEVNVVTTDANGCEGQDTYVIEVKKIVGVYVPTAFTPNGDGNNDELRIGHYNLTVFQIQIYNRWGQLVFEADQPDFAWNGADQGGKAVPEGVYVYYVDAADIDGNQIQESRTITVLR